jgi:hypothetical protein
MPFSMFPTSHTFLQRKLETEMGLTPHRACNVLARVYRQERVGELITDSQQVSELDPEDQAELWNIVLEEKVKLFQELYG